MSGKASKKQGWVKGDMAPARRGAYKLLSSQQNPAVSYFISHGFSEDAALPERCRLYLIKPFSGKTHQIRVALKSVSAAILGDELYQASPADRVYLHAYALRFQLAGQLYQYRQLPEQGQFYLTPAVQQQLATAWAAPWQLTWPQYQRPQQLPAAVTQCGHFVLATLVHQLEIYDVRLSIKICRHWPVIWSQQRWRLFGRPMSVWLALVVSVAGPLKLSPVLGWVKSL